MNLDALGERLSNYPSTDDAIDKESIEHPIHGVGTSRIVVQHPEDDSKVVKFGVGLSGHRQNKAEVKVYQKAVENDVEDMLVPIIDYNNNYNWIVMPFVDCPDKRIGKTAGPKAKKIKNKLSDHGIALYELETVEHNGSAKAYDYGSTENLY